MPEPLRVLFVGNSYTHCNSMPSQVAAIAASLGAERPLESKSITTGGHTFQKHWNEDRIDHALARGRFDLAVLQNNSLEPVNAPEPHFEFGCKVGEKLKAAGCDLLLYLTWARRHKPEMQDTLDMQYEKLARTLKARIVPAGTAWARALKDSSLPVLHVADDSHPTFEGSYLAACAFFARFYGRSPEGAAYEFAYEGAEPVKMNAAQAKAFQRIAWDAAQAWQRKESEWR